MNDTSPQTLKMAVNLFLRGEPLVYRGVEFTKLNKSVLLICSYCDCKLEDANPKMAKESFKRSKAILAELSEISSEFKKAAQRMSHDYYFAYYYDKGSDVLAKEIGGLFESDFPYDN